MLLQIAVLLFLFVSGSSGATLGYHQAEEVEEAPTVDGAVADTIVNAIEQDVSPGDAQVGDLPGGQKSAAASSFGEMLLAKLLNNKAADGAETYVPVVNGATAEGLGTDGDRPAGDAGLGGVTGDEQPSSSENDIRALETNQNPETPSTHGDSSWSLNSVRSSFQTVHGYFDSLVELVGGHDGVCQYRCRYGESPQPRPGYQLSEPDGCSSPLMGFQFDLGIPAMTECCNQLDVCYETCGTNKYDCDFKFRVCLHSICSDINKSLGFSTKVQACESMADALYDAVWTLGCRPYMNSQRAACVCEGEERDEL
ncbi:group XIIB secretory phospholipase A2-like protein isoform X2 [Antennarius striatus]|uniref:group XIIB secretory phospholipase A2-like protein isoform X2 n=1 Tax=Antennarius striatus TaxID=241820 RepID=UPI0035B1FDEB